MPEKLELNPVGQPLCQWNIPHTMYLFLFTTDRLQFNIFAYFIINYIFTFSWFVVI